MTGKKQTKEAKKKIRKAKLGNKNPNWKNGKLKTRNRWYILKPDHPNANSMGYVRQSRLVMEQKIGRLLNLKEVVHHKNGDTLDDRPENKSLFENHSKHMIFHHSKL